MRLATRLCVLLLLAAFAAPGLLAGPDPQPASTPAPPGRSFAVEFRTGPKWYAAKPPHEQPYFKEHSENLKRLRGEGRILVGARYGEVGLIVVAGASEEEVRGLFAADPSLQNGVFAFTVHEFRVFYPGCVGAKPQ
jgi:uncharacterized protein YciI